jgi:hypothetical protein
MVAALFLAVLSFLSFPLFVHTYCENRPIMLALATCGMGTCYCLIRFWPLTLLRRIGAALAVLLCLLGVCFNLWFFSWATHICAQQKALH